MRTRSILFLGFIVALVIMAQEQTPPHIHHENEKELSNLGYFVGSWILTATVGQGESKASGEYRQAQKIQWMKGEHFLISNTETKGTLGDSVGLAVTGFDADLKKFVYHAFNSTGTVEHGTGVFDGKMWIWLSEPPKPEVHLQRRITLVEVGPKEYTFKLETTPDSKNWGTVMEGRAIKNE
jgi:hypothetical protein